MNWLKKRGVLPLLLSAVVIIISSISVYIVLSYYLPPTDNHVENNTGLFNATNSSTSTPSALHSLSHPNLTISAVNERAGTALTITLQDAHIIDMINRWLDSGAQVTVVGVQPVELPADIKISAPHRNPVHHELIGMILKPLLKPMLDNLREEVSNNNTYKSNRYGEVVITINWHIMGGHQYPVSAVVDLEREKDKVYEIHQQITRVIVDIDERRVKDIIMGEETVIRHDIKPNKIYMESNSFMPYTVIIKPSTILYWHNYSTLSHNIVGIYKTLDGSSILIDSKDIGGGEIWQYLFTKEGEFEYHCTYHKDEGMSGKVIIR